MKRTNKRLILANGEAYARPIEKKSSGGPKEYPRSFDEARVHVTQELNNTLEAFNKLPREKRLEDEAVFCIRLHPDFNAKSFEPQYIFSEETNLRNVGSRYYRTQPKNVGKTKRITKMVNDEVDSISGRLIFASGSEGGYLRLLEMINRKSHMYTQAFQHEIQRIETINLLPSCEQILGLEEEWEEWEEGRVEIVFHPSKVSVANQTNFLKELLPTESRKERPIRTAQYENGPLFISCYLNKSGLLSLGGANPLRTAHPLELNSFEELRSNTGLNTPPPPTTNSKSTIKIGMFDGGISKDHPLLKGHVEEDTSFSPSSLPVQEGIDHGTAVAGAILYGPLNNYDTENPLPPPEVSVVSFRVLPTSDPTDIDLYESIDIIEKVVPQRKDIKTYNLSFGPRGPILDDKISRFTYALDTLAAKHDVTFCVAVGNDGQNGHGCDRIQAPSDIANGFGVGAHTERNGKLIHAPYSCKGPGRESAKLKPDLVAFGGCDQNPIHLIASTHLAKAVSRGTSFSAPLVSSICGQTHGIVQKCPPLLARALMLHHSEHPEGKPDHLLGHGIAPNNTENLLSCSDKSVTLVYKGSILAKKMIKLPILLPPNLITKGMVSLRWTIAGLPPIEPNHPADYTSMCIEDTYYPNSNSFKFSPPKGSIHKPVTKNMDADMDEILDLIEQGWRQGALPVSKSGNQYATEEERRADHKWESIVRRETTMRANSLNEPFLVLHAIPRHDATLPIQYAAVVTISSKKYSGDLYDAVVRRFTALQPIRLRTETEIRVNI